VLKLGQKREPVWLDLVYGVRVKVRPLTAALYQTAFQGGLVAARALINHQKAIVEAGGRIEDMPDLSDPAGAEGLSQALFVKELAVAALLEWENVTGPDDKPAPVTPQHVREAFDDHLVAETFLTSYVYEHQKRLAEGNASAPSPSGTSAGALDTAKPAASKKSRARKGRKAVTANAAPIATTPH
jgi:hypothetical protein